MAAVVLESTGECKGLKEDDAPNDSSTDTSVSTRQDKPMGTRRRYRCIWSTSRRRKAQYGKES